MSTDQLTLRFTDWRCGHHATRPADIDVQTPAQAVQICLAICHAISQPGHARAVLMSAANAVELYITDDHVSEAHSARLDDLGTPATWNDRPVVVYGTAAEVEELHGPALQGARDDMWWILDRLHPTGFVNAGDYVSTTLNLAELEAMAAPVEWHEERTRRERFEFPPVFRPASELLAELRQQQVEIDAYDAEIAAEAAQNGGASV